MVAAGLVACHNCAAVGDGGVVMEAAAIDGQGTQLPHVHCAAVDSLIVIELTAVDGDGVVLAADSDNTTVLVCGRIIVVFAAINGKDIIVVQIYAAAIRAAVIVDFNVLNGNGGTAAVFINTIAGVFSKYRTIDQDIVVATIRINAAAGVARKGHILGCNINIMDAIYCARQVAQGQSFASKYQRVADGGRIAVAHINAIAGAGEDAAGAACFIIGGRFIGQGKGVGVLVVGQGDLAGEGIAVQVQGDGVIHGGSRDLLAHIGQQVDAGVATLILGRIQRGLQGGVLFAGPGA